MTKYLFLTGGVVSSLGKGIVLSSIGALLRKHKIHMIKIDPYLNYDPGTMSPYQHGEVYVTANGKETDLDLGNYERFTGSGGHSNYTTGRIFHDVINQERRGDYLGQTVQIVPHLTDHIKWLICQHDGNVDYVLVEIGGTVGDIESKWFLEAIRQLTQEKPGDCMVVHLSLVPRLNACGELKTKPTQHSVATLMTHGLVPDIIICRSDVSLNENIRKKIAFHCRVAEDCVFGAMDLDCIYKMPNVLAEQGLLCCLERKWGTEVVRSDMNPWDKLFHQSCMHGCSIAIVGKYTENKDAYKSLEESLKLAGRHLNTGVLIVYIEARHDDTVVRLQECNADAVIVAGGFGQDGIRGKLRAIRYCRENNVPFIGICLGFQLAVIEYCTNVCGITCRSAEWEEDMLPGPNVVAIINPKCKIMGGTMRLGDRDITLVPGTLSHKIYGTDVITERHRHRYDVDADRLTKWQPDHSEPGMCITGWATDIRMPEIVEIPEHPFFIGVQFHPEYNSTVFSPHPLFTALIRKLIPLQ